MKRTILFIVVVIITISQTFAADIVVENPPFSVCSHSNVYITKVTMSEEATYLTMAVHHSPTSWIRMASDTYIRVNGKKYIVQSAEGVALDEEVYSDESGKTVFTLKFDPIASDAKQLDFIESDCESCFKIWGVELKSNVLTNRLEVPQKIKEAAIVKEDGKSLEAPQLKAGNATLKGQLLGYLPEMNWKINLYINNPITRKQEGLDVSVQEDGSFELQVPLITTMQVLFRTPICNNYILLSPDKETDIYIDLQQKSCQELQHRVDKCPDSKYMYFSGANAEINNQMWDSNISDYYRNTFYNQEMYKEIVGMTAEQYKSYILDKVDVASREFSQKGLTKKALEFAMIDLYFTAAYKLAYAKYDLENAYRITHNLTNREDKLTGYVAPVFDKSYYSYLKDFNINSNFSFYSREFGSTASSAQRLDNKQIRINLPDNDLYQQLIKSGKLSQEDLVIAESQSKQTWDNWDADWLRLFKESGVKYVQELIDSGQLTGDRLSEANKLSALYADRAQQHVPSLIESRLEFQLNLSKDGIIPRENVAITFGIKELDEIAPERKEQTQKFNEKYAAEISSIQLKKSIEKSKSDLGAILGTTQGPIFDLMEVHPLGGRFEEYQPLTAEEINSLSNMKDRFYSDYFKEKNNQLLAQLEANKGKKGYNVHEVPEGSGDSFFSELIKPFAGKVVLVDFWATWCAPCRVGMKELEPHKEKLKEQGVVFVYLTNESSPVKTWNNMIPDISGEHFRLTDAQFEILSKKFGIQGIPSYLILNKEGEQAHFWVGWGGVDQLKSKLEKEL